MKKISVLIAAFICCILWLSCKKSKSSTPDPVIPAGIFATINGVKFTASQTSTSSITGGSLNSIEITGYDSTGKTIDLRINNFMTRGTYNIPQVNDSAFYSTDYGALVSPIAATSGTISIEAVNDTAVGGTFSYNAAGTIVTSGTFYVNYN